MKKANLVISILLISLKRAKTRGTVLTEDAEALEKTFLSLGFHVDRRDDLDGTAWNKLMTNVLHFHLFYPKSLCYY